jgi:hypothetical protein
MRRASSRLVWVAAGGIAAAIAGCKDETPTVLQPSDLQPTRLSAAERKLHIGECRKAFQGSFPDASAPGGEKVMSEASAEGMCDCYIDRLEDQTNNKIEFLIVMQVIAGIQTVRAVTPPVSIPPLPHQVDMYGLMAGMRRLEAGAGRIGVTAPRFQEMALNARKVGEPAMIQCLERATGGR